MKIAATIKTDFNLASLRENFTEIYFTQDIKRGRYAVSDHPETTQTLKNRVTEKPDGNREVVNELERTVVLIPVEDLERKLNEAGKHTTSAIKAVSGGNDITVG